MKYIVFIFLLILLFYLLSFAIYNWRNNNKIAAIGSAVLGIAAFALPLVLIFFGNYEM